MANERSSCYKLHTHYLEIYFINTFINTLLKRNVHLFYVISVGDKGKARVVCVYLCFQQHSQFLFCKLESSAGQLTVSPLNTVYCPEYDLVSFTCPADWRLVGWEAVTTCDNDMLLPEKLENMNEEDPRQVYLSALFDPGAFLPSTLLKTVAIFRRSVDGRDETLSWDRLRDEVVIAVENEIQNNLADYEVTDED